MVLHFAYRQILTYALKDKKSSTFEYFYLKTAQKQTKFCQREPPKGIPPRQPQTGLPGRVPSHFLEPRETRCFGILNNMFLKGCSLQVGPLPGNPVRGCLGALGVPSSRISSAFGLFLSKNTQKQTTLYLLERMWVSIDGQNVGPQVHCFEQKPGFDNVNTTCQTRTPIKF